MRAVFVIALLLAAPSGRVSGHVKGDRSGIVVWLEGVPAKARERAAKKIFQRDLSFDPPLTVLVVGDSIEFPNEDKVFHNVFSVSSPARFDLGLYKSGASKTVTFDKPGTVDIFCNIHPQMVAKVKVLDTPWFAVSDANGKFVIEGVPPGTWPLVAWQPHGPEVRQTVEVKGSEPVTLELELQEGNKPRWHLRKDGTPYGRYR